MATVGPSRNSIVAMAFEGLRKDERRMKRIATMTKPKPEKADVHTKPAKVKQIAADVHKKVGKAPARKKGGRK